MCLVKWINSIHPLMSAPCKQRDIQDTHVPYAEYITRDVKRFVARQWKLDLVIFVDEHPSGICNSDDARAYS